jgi:hypothetical protein
MFYAFHNAALNKLEYFQERNEAAAIVKTRDEGRRIFELYVYILTRLRVLSDR